MSVAKEVEKKNKILSKSFDFTLNIENFIVNMPKFTLLG